jgi:hypothetical protein
MVDTIRVVFDPARLTGKFVRENGAAAPIWNRILAKAIDVQSASITESAIELPWSAVLSLVLEFGTRNQQQQLSFRFRPEDQAAELLKKFAEEVQATRKLAADSKLPHALWTRAVLRGVASDRKWPRPMET